MPIKLPRSACRPALIALILVSICRASSVWATETAPTERRADCHPCAAPMTTAAPLRVVATFSILADLTRAIGGDAVAVTSLAPTGGDLHNFEATPADVSRFGAAQLVISNGWGLELWLPRLEEANHYAVKHILAGGSVTPRRNKEGIADAHAWQSPRWLMTYVDNIASTLADLRPAAKDTILQRAAAYRAQLARLQTTLKNGCAHIPANRRLAVSLHDSYGYLAAECGIEMLHIQGLASESEPTAADLARLTRTLRARPGATIFTDNLGDSRLLQRISEESGAKIGGELYSDALTAPGGAADTTLKLIEHNINTLLQALQSDKP